MGEQRGRLAACGGAARRTPSAPRPKVSERAAFVSIGNLSLLSKLSVAILSEIKQDTKTQREREREAKIPSI